MCKIDCSCPCCSWKCCVPFTIKECDKVRKCLEITERCKVPPHKRWAVRYNKQGMTDSPIHYVNVYLPERCVPQRVENAIKAIKGVKNTIHTDISFAYEIHIEVATVYTWEEIKPQVAKILMDWLGDDIRQVSPEFIFRDTTC